MNTSAVKRQGGIQARQKEARAFHGTREQLGEVKRVDAKLDQIAFGFEALVGNIHQVGDHLHDQEGKPNRQQDLQGGTCFLRTKQLEQ